MNASTTRRVIRLGSALALVASVNDAKSAETIAVQTPDIELAYRVNPESEPLTSVTIWYTADQGQSWTLYGADPDLRSPAHFQAPADGAFGLFLVLQNETGPSSQPPSPGTTPHLSVIVDRTAPIAQIHELRTSLLFGKQVLQIRWSAIDSNLAARPVQLEYTTPEQTNWHPVTDGPVANTGRFDWTLPDGLQGEIVLRIVVRDQSGHVTESNRMSAVITPDPTARTESSIPEDRVTFHLRTTQPAGTERVAGGPSISGSPRARARATELIAQARTREQEGDMHAAIARLRDAVRLDPNRTDAFAEMARIFYQIGEWDRALSAYDIVLKHDPAKRDALLGAAMVLAQRKDYSAAGEKLRTILRHNPQDAEVWMNLGDVAIYSGDEVLARDCYMRASGLDSAAPSVVDKANKRLRLMDDVSRRYTDQ